MFTIKKIMFESLNILIFNIDDIHKINNNIEIIVTKDNQNDWWDIKKLEKPNIPEKPL